VWTLALGAVLVLPFLYAFLPAWNLPLLPARSPASVAASHESVTTRMLPGQLIAQAAAEPVTSLTDAGAAEPSMSTPNLPRPKTGGSPSSVPDARWLLYLWAAGVAAFLLPLAGGLLSLRRLGRIARPMTDGPALCVLSSAARELGLAPSICLVESEQRSIPMTWGLARPVILLPECARGWSRERLKMVFLHELAHVRRGDYMTQLFARTVCAIHWFNPLAWLALARMRVEQERACDDLALAHGFDPADYARHLLAIVSRNKPRSGSLAVASAVSSSAHVEHRLRSILDPSQDRRALGRRQVAAWAVCVACTVAVLATGRLAAARPAIAAENALQETSREKDEPPAVAAKDQAQVIEQLRQLSVNPPDQAALTVGAIQGMIEVLHDPYATYLGPEKLAELDRNIAGLLTGIGVQLKESEGRILVERPLPDSPALNAGIRPGDEILEIDGQPTKSMKLSELVKRIAGPAGSKVILKIAHADGRLLTSSITRSAIKIPTVIRLRPGTTERSAWLIDRDQKIGYARITQFSSSTPAELKDALAALKEEGMKGLILDLRSCAGGLLDAALEVANAFLKEGTIITTRGRDGAEKTFQADPEKALGDSPLVVMVNEVTASAAEVVAGAIQARERAVVVGTRTTGKGSIQTIVKLDNGAGAIKLTTSYYILPNGRNLDKTAGKLSWGVDPNDGDFVPMDARRFEAILRLREGVGPAADATVARIDSTDVQLTAALKAMAGKLTTGEFPKVGQPLSALTAYVNRLEEIRKRRDALRKDLEAVEHELDELHKAK
jgi:carboxyl-terminal processing protease